MRTLLLIFTITLTVFASACDKGSPGGEKPEPPSPQPSSSSDFINAASLNIRYSNNTDGINNWDHRKQWVVDFIYFFDIDLIGLQEEKNDQTAELRTLLSADYGMIGKASSSQPGYEYNGIYYKTENIELLESGRFWLSETPDVESVGWDAKYHRQVTWGKFRHKASNNEFYFFNTHFSHVGETARENSAILLKNKIKSIAKGAAVIATGDFNLRPNSSSYNILTQDSDSAKKLSEGRILVDRPYNALCTGHCFGTCYKVGKIVDYVFVNDKIDVEKYGILTEQREGVFLSDHYPILTRLRFK
ncbi:endonuclease/exonuclease/phosphatase family protein [Marinifilum caeruleilacunae]|nr:endonuclease/exonuclease/phosphatase family protein [Marinifilum caeruleilacunae]